MSNVTTSTASPSINTPKQPKRRLNRVILLIVIPAIAAIVVGIMYMKGGRYVETDNSYIKAEKVPVSSEVAGRVKEVLVHENQSVTANQVLFRLDPAPFQVAVAKAEARLAQAGSDLAALKAGYREKQAEITLAQTSYNFAMKDQQRKADLMAKHYISSSQFDEARQQTALATQQIAVQQQDLRRIAETLGGGVDTPVERHPAYLAALADLAQAKLDLSRVEIRAPAPGIVTKPPKQGQFLTTGSTATALVVSDNVWIEANFTETDLTYVHPGQPVTIHVDTYPGVEWKGVVDSLSPATGAEFSVIPAQNATGNWVKIAQRVPVRIRIETIKGKPELRAGLSTSVEIDTGHRRHLPGLSH